MGQELELGSDEAFRAFVTRHRDRAIALAYRLLAGNRPAAEDVAQEAFLRAHRAWGGFRGDAATATWFTRILINSARSHLRSRRRRERWLSLFGLARDEATGRTPEEETEDAGKRVRIVAAMEELTDAQREVFVLVHLEGLTIAAAAEVLDRAPGTLKSHLHRALVVLRRELADLRAA